MDFLTLAFGFVSGPWGPLVGLGVTILLHRLGVPIPLLTPKPTTPTDPQLPAPLAPMLPQTPTHPILDAILKQIFGSKSPAPHQLDPSFLGKLKSEVESILALVPATSPTPPAAAK